MFFSHRYGVRTKRNDYVEPRLHGDHVNCFKSLTSDYSTIAVEDYRTADVSLMTSQGDHFVAWSSKNLDQGLCGSLKMKVDCKLIWNKKTHARVSTSTGKASLETRGSIGRWKVALSHPGRGDPEPGPPAMFG